jgi:hypothetical protein
MLQFQCTIYDTRNYSAIIAVHARECWKKSGASVIFARERQPNVRRLKLPYATQSSTERNDLPHPMRTLIK